MFFCDVTFADPVLHRSDFTMDIEALRRLLKGPAYANGSDIIANAVCVGRCKEFVEYAAGLRLNRKTRKTWIGIVLEYNAVWRGKKIAVWYSVFEKELWLLWRCHYQMACPQTKVDGAPILDVSGSARKMLARTGLVRYHKTPVKAAAAKAFSTLRALWLIWLWLWPHVPIQTIGSVPGPLCWDASGAPGPLYFGRWEACFVGPAGI